MGLFFLLIEFDYLQNGFNTPFIILTTIVISVGLVYSYYGFTNNDFILTDDSLEVENRFPFFKKKTSIELKNIQAMYFRDDSLINILSEYKYVIIKFADKESSNKTYKVRCHGLEFDCNGENINLPTFDDFYNNLKTRGIKVMWLKAIDF